MNFSKNLIPTLDTSIKTHNLVPNNSFVLMEPDANIAAIKHMFSTENNERYTSTWETDSVTTSETQNFSQSEDMFKVLFVSHYSEESKGPRCEKSSKPPKRLRQEDEFINMFATALDKPHMKAARSEATDSFSGEIQNRVENFMQSRKENGTPKGEKEVKLLTSTTSQTLATFPQTNASFEGLFKDLQIGNLASDFLDTFSVASVNKSNAIESAKNTTDTNTDNSVVAASESDIKSNEKNHVAANYPKPLKKLLHSSVVPSNKSSVPPRATVVGQQTINKVIQRILTENNTFHNYPIPNGTSFFNDNYMPTISNENGNTSDESDDTDSVSSSFVSSINVESYNVVPSTSTAQDFSSNTSK